MARNFGRHGGVATLRQGQRRQTEWLASAIVTDVQTLPALNIILDQLLTTAELAKRPFTVVRTRGTLTVWSDQAAAFETPFGGMGFMVVSEKAAALGVTAVPTPVLNQKDDGFFVYESFQASAGNTVVGQSDGRQVMQFDSKAQRKVEEGENIVVTLENSSAADGLFYIVQFRLLIKVA